MRIALHIVLKTHTPRGAQKISARFACHKYSQLCIRPWRQTRRPLTNWSEKEKNTALLKVRLQKLAF